MLADHDPMTPRSHLHLTGLSRCLADPVIDFSHQQTTPAPDIVNGDRPPA